jgi:hypothetical protein
MVRACVPERYTPPSQTESASERRPFVRGAAYRVGRRQRGKAGSSACLRRAVAIRTTRQGGRQCTRLVTPCTKLPRRRAAIRGRSQLHIGELRHSTAMCDSTAPLRHRRRDATAPIRADCRLTGPTRAHRRSQERRAAAGRLCAPPAAVAAAKKVRGRTETRGMRRPDSCRCCDQGPNPPLCPSWSERPSQILHKARTPLW